MLRQLEFLCFMVIKYYHLSYQMIFRARLMTAVHSGAIINSEAESFGYLSAVWQSWCSGAPDLAPSLGAIFDVLRSQCLGLMAEPKL